MSQKTKNLRKKKNQEPEEKSDIPSDNDGKVLFSLICSYSGLVWCQVVWGCIIKGQL